MSRSYVSSLALHRLGCVVRPVLLDGPLQHAVEELLPVGHVEREHDAERTAHLLEHLVERLGLRKVARVAVENEARHGVAAREAICDERNRDLVRNEMARGEEGLHLLAEVGAARDRVAVEIAARNVRNAVRRRDLLRLGALA